MPLSSSAEMSCAIDVLGHLGFVGVPSPFVDTDPGVVTLIWEHKPVDAIVTIDARGIVRVNQAPDGDPRLDLIIRKVARVEY